jgi:hypothetical protein
MQTSISQLSSKLAGLSAAMKTLPFILLALAMLCLAGCTPLGMAAGGTIGGIYATKPDEGQPADLSLQTPQHESWCYETSGYPECYAYPQKDANNRLIMVDPPSRYPLSARGYHEDVIESQQP